MHLLELPGDSPGFLVVVIVSSISNDNRISGTRSRRECTSSSSRGSSSRGSSSGSTTTTTTTATTPNATCARTARRLYRFREGKASSITAKSKTAVII